MSGTPSTPQRPIAVIGIGCRFPGDIHDARSFWELVSAGRDAITEIPRDRFDLERFFDARPATRGRSMTRWGGFVGPLDRFDAEFFGLAPREAERLDPQQRLLLETAWEALEDAGQNIVRLEGSVTGVYVGQWVSDFESRLFADPATVDFYSAMGTGRYASSGRLSYLLGLRGPSLTLDTACSSSLVAVHLAVQSIRSGESELAIAGGANLILQPQITIAYSQTRMMAADGHCKFGDASGDGYVRSEGVGLVVLKALDRAIADGDRIYAVIRGSAVNNDGRSSGSMGRPSRIGQEELLRAAYRDSGVEPGQVEYVEAHGTGTRAGDPVELDALGAVLGPGRTGARAFVGSVKTNFGHTEGAAGIAGLIKAVLSLHHGEIAPSLHYNTPNPKIAWDTLPLEIVRERRAWQNTNAPRFAGVTAFGIGGTNAHVVLESAPPVSVAVPVPREVHFLPLSARNPAALRELCSRYAARIERSTADALASICATAASRRSPLAQRAVCIGRDSASMAELLRQQAEGSQVLATGEAGAAPRIAFVVPGQGAQWVGMGRILSATEPVFHAALLECDRAARRYVDWSIVEELGRDPGAPQFRLERIDVIQPILVALAIAYARWLESVGIRPDAVIGHSMGEVGAAHLAGALDLDQAMRIICRRSALMRAASGRGAMAAVDISSADMEARLGPRAARASVAVVNSTRSCVVSGDPEAITQIMADCERDGILCRRVKVDVAAHSPQMDGPAAKLASELAGLSASAASIPFYSTVDERSCAGTELDAGYWGRNMRQPVRFAATIAQMIRDGFSVFVELSPHAVLAQAVEQTGQAVGNASVHAFACGRRDEDEQTNLYRVAARLWALGAPVTLEALCGKSTAVDLPHYPWQRERYWVREANPRETVGSSTLPESGIDEFRSWLHCLRWIALAADPGAGIPRDLHWLVVTGEERWGDEIVRALGAGGHRARWLDVSALPEALRIERAAGIIALLPVRDSGSAFRAVSVMQASAAAASGSAGAIVRCWFVTRGAQAVRADEPDVDATQSAAWGAARVLAREHPEHRGGLIDLDARATPAEGAAHLCMALGHTSFEHELAVRDGALLGLRLDALPEEATQTNTRAWRADGAYLISGGLGEIGLLIARAMVRGGARRLILLGRTALPPRSQWSSVDAQSPLGKRVAAVRELEAGGASVHALTADVADAARLEAAIATYTQESWPPIVGVIHAAGVTESRLALSMDAGTFARALAPKLDGAANLDRLFPNVQDFIVFSSISALLGWAGMSNYAAGNAAIDGVIAARRARGASGLSIQWGTWSQTGLFSGDAAERHAVELERQGIRSFRAQDALAIFDWAAGSGLPGVTVMPVDWARFRATHAGGVPAMFAHRVADTGAAAPSQDEFMRQLAAASSPRARGQLLERAVLGVAAQVLGVAPQKLDVSKPLGTSGLDSIMAIELRNRLEALLGRSLSATLAWNYPTVEAIAGHLNDITAVNAETPAPSAPASVAQPAAPLAPNVEAVAELSDADVLRRLRARPRQAG